MLMDKIILATIGALVVYTWVSDSKMWALPLGIGALTLTRSDWLLLSSGLALAGLEVYFAAVRYEKHRNQQEQEAEVFLQRLAELLPLRGTLNLALQDLAADNLPAQSAADPVFWLDRVFSRWQVNAVGMVASAAHVASRHGGSLQAVVEQASRKIVRDRQRRFQRQLEEASQRTTILVLAFAPYLVMGLLWLIIKPMYEVLIGTGLGHGIVAAEGLTSGAILAVLGLHIKRDGKER